MRRAIFWTAGVSIILFFGFSLFVANRVPRIEDAEATYKILEEFRLASTNMIADKQIRTTSNPRRGATRLYIYGNLSTGEEKALNELAVKISHNNSNRPISVEFRAEVQQGTNN